MAMWKNIIAAMVVLLTMNSCSFLFEYEECDEVGYTEPDYYVDAYVYIPYHVRELIAGCVDGYSMPEVNRYGQDIYPDAAIYDRYNLPSYISTDFNGDGVFDYAYMFSRVTWSNDSWFLKTKLLVVVSSEYGHVISSEYDLGSTSAHANVPVEEYWGIRLLRRGHHTIEILSNDGTVEKASFFLENDGLYLGSIEPEERTVFYVTGSVLREFYLDMGAVAKKKVITDSDRANRVLPFKK